MPACKHRPVYPQGGDGSVLASRLVGIPKQGWRESMRESGQKRGPFTTVAFDIAHANMLGTCRPSWQPHRRRAAPRKANPITPARPRTGCVRRTSVMDRGTCTRFGGEAWLLTRFGVAASAPALRRRERRRSTPHRTPRRAWEQRRHRCLWRRPWGHEATAPLRVHVRAA